MNTLVKLLLAFVLNIVADEVPPQSQNTDMVEMVECKTDTVQRFGYFINAQTANYLSKNEQYVQKN